MLQENNCHRLISIVLDEVSIGRNTPDVEHERDVAIFDLIEKNFFALCGHDKGPYYLKLAIAESKLVFDISLKNGQTIVIHALSFSPFKGIIKDYFLLCESYFDAIKSASSSRIEAIDMGRRGLHNEASQLLMERLKGKIVLDLDTARRLFTLICALHWRGTATTYGQ